MSDSKNSGNNSDTSSDNTSPFNSEMNNPTRKRSIFTERDRRYILDHSIADGQRERDIRYRIRKRLEQGIYDLELAGLRIKRDEVEKVISNIPYRELDIIMNSIMYLILKIVNRLETWSNQEQGDRVDILESKIASSIDSNWGPGDVNVIINIDYYQPEEDINKLVSEFLLGEASYKDFEYIHNEIGTKKLLRIMREDGVEEVQVEFEDPRQPPATISQNYLEGVIEQGR